MSGMVLFSNLTKAGFLFVLISMVSCTQNPPGLTIDFPEHILSLDDRDGGFIIKDVYFSTKNSIDYDTILSYSLLQDSIGDASIYLGKTNSKYSSFFDNNIMLMENTKINVFVRICKSSGDESLFIFDGTYSWEYLTKNTIKLHPLNPRI